MSSINTLRGPRLHRAPQFHRSKLARAPHLDSSNPTEEGFLKRNIVPMAGLALTAFVLSACAVDPSSIPVAPAVDTWKQAIERNPFHYPQIAAEVAGIIAGVSSGITSGVKHARHARDPNKHKYNYFNAVADTLFDGVSNGLVGAYGAGIAVLLYELGISKDILDRVVSQLPALGGIGLAIGALNSAQKIQDMLQLVRLPEGWGRQNATPTATPPAEE